MTKYLYGASIQGIQSFIFSTNKLKEIVGGSELVEQLCTTVFREVFKEHKLDHKEKESIIAAAGSVKHLFSDKEDAGKIFKYFPMKAMKAAPGVTLSQAIVEVKGELKQEHINELEDKLKVERNKAPQSEPVTYMVMERMRTTGKAAVKVDRKEFIDTATLKKREISRHTDKGFLAKLFKNRSERIHWNFTKNLEDVVSDDNWLAVIHADGNSIGLLIQDLIEWGGDKSTDVYKYFSKSLADATQGAVYDAIVSVIADREKDKSDGVLPVRPVIVGGDDVTFIVQAECGLLFTKVYLEAFQKRTKEMLEAMAQKFHLSLGGQMSKFKEGLTACAGIAYTKQKFPFHYAVDLAEDLCKASKKAKDSSNLVPSSLMFHKIHDSFITSYEEIKERMSLRGIELVSPYLLESKKDSKQSSLSLLEQRAAKYMEGTLSTNLREWLNIYAEDNERAKIRLRRLERLHGSTELKDGENGGFDQDEVGVLFDVLSLASLNCSFIKKAKNQSAYV